MSATPVLPSVIVAGHYNLWLLLLGFAVVCVSAYNALHAVERLQHRRGRERWLWRGVGMVSLGGGIWAMHFIGLLAYRTPAALEFKAEPSLLSLLVALLSALGVMLYVSQDRVRGRAMLPAALLVGLGFAGMLVLAQHTVETVVVKDYRLDLRILSLLLAQAVAYLTLRVMLHLQHQHGQPGRKPLVLGALVIGAGALAMHLLSMQSVRLSVATAAPGLLPPSPPSVHLALEVALVIGILSGIILLGTYVGRLSDRRMQTLLQRLGRSESVDPMTQLPLEAMAREQMTQLSIRITRPATIAFFLVDCDRAERIGVLQGEDARGDAMRLLAQRLGSMKGGQRDMLAVTDSGRFVVITPIMLPEQAQARARFMADVCMAPIEVRGRSLHVPVRVGYSVWPQDGNDFDDLLASAELALHGTQSGRADTSGYTPEMRRLSDRRLEIEHALAAALDEGALDVAYQPIVHAKDRSLASLEALARWRHPTLGQVPPDEFIPVADELGLSAEIDRFVLRRALADFATLPPHVRQPLNMAVNCAASTLEQPRLLQEVEAILGSTGISSRRLTLEVTEVAWAKGGEEILHTLQQIQKAGIRLSIDDFGTGYSSLARLQRLPAGSLKVDREFVSSLGTPRADEMVRAIIELALRLSIKVIAEGVETEAQERFLLDAGCHYLQGYRYGRPVPWAQLSVGAAT